MRRVLELSLAVLLWVETAQAQTMLQRPRYQSPNPTTSPYLNMLRGGNPAINYFGVVRPQTETNRSLQNLQQQMTEQGPLGMVPPTAPNDPAVSLSTTGHPVSFFNTSHYFPVSATRPVMGSSSGMGNQGMGSNPLSVGIATGQNGMQPFVGINPNRR